MGRTRANCAQDRMPSLQLLPTVRWWIETPSRARGLARGHEAQGTSRSDRWAEAVARLDAVYILASSVYIDMTPE
jgi:hypothetical protein